MRGDEGGEERGEGMGEEQVKERKSEIVVRGDGEGRAEGNEG